MSFIESGVLCGRILTMKTTIDSPGRLVIPKEVRREAGLKPGMPLEVRWHDGRIEIEPAPLPVKLVRKGRLLVAVPENIASPLTTETVERTRTISLI
ncbi:MAG: AbrB/MazE/SpoVT family DNA-binding domain-containing protein [Thermodesulfobacteriota bacterium]